MLTAKNIDLYYGASQALQNVSIDAHKGEITCVLGRNGVGKSSLMQSITGRHIAKAGNITWEGKDITKMPAADRARKGIAYVPQGRQIFSQLTVHENLKTGFAVLPRGERKIPDEIFDLFPILRTMLRRRGGDLSGGQQQQLSIARALIMKPRLLILDEPTEGIQPSIIKDIHKVITILKQQGDMAILLVELILIYAMFVMSLLTIGVGLIAVKVRKISVNKGLLVASYFRLMQGEEAPDAVIKTTRCFNNLFEVPVLFYTASILYVSLEIESLIGIIFAWLFVLLRGVQAYVHITYNNVRHRMLTFGLSILCVLILWVNLVVKNFLAL